MVRSAAVLVVLGSVVLLAVPQGNSQRTDQVRFAPDHAGRLAVTVKTFPNPKATAREVAAFAANLARLRDVLLAGPMFNPPRGVDVTGWLDVDHKPGLDARAPLVGTGYIQFYRYALSSKTGQPYRVIATTAEVNVWVNQPDANLEPRGGPGFYVAPERIGEVAGLPVYRRAGGNDLLILHAGAKPVWVPVTREEFAARAVRAWEKQAADAVPMDTITPKIAAAQKAALAAMSPEERRMPARYLEINPMDLPLAPPGAAEGEPILKLNPEWYDPALPKTQIQLVSLFFRYGGGLDEQHPESTQIVDSLRVWEWLHKSDWAAIKNLALASK